MAWTREHLTELISQLQSHGGDLAEVEVKRAAGGTPDLKETLCAFGNMPEGGTIVLGLDEAANFAAVGVHGSADLEAGIAGQARTAVVPAVQVDFERIAIDGATIVIVTVAGLPSSQRPCRTKSGNTPYLRQADGDYPMSEQEVQQILALRERPRHDIVPVDGTNLGNLDVELKTNFIATARAGSRRLSDASDEEVLRLKRVLEPVGERLTLAGLYALGKYPQQFEPHLSITAVSEPPTRGESRNLDRAEFDGPLPELLDRAVEWVHRNTRTKVRFGIDGHGRDESEIPMVAVRELIANALVHRDLGPHTTGKDVQIRLTNDRLVIASPGGLWGLSRRQLGQAGAKSAVNEFLYEICKLTRTPSGNRVIEGEGGGLREVGSSLTDAGLRRPEYHDNGIKFTALVPRHSLIGPDDLAWLGTVGGAHLLTILQRQILVSMRHGQSWTNQSVRNEFGPLDSTEARSCLQGLVSAGLAVANGSGRSTSYTIDPSLDPESIARVEKHPLADTLAAPFPLETPSATALNDLRGAAAAATKNGLVIWNAVTSAPGTIAEIQAATGLNVSQLRYGLKALADAKLIVRNGGQGRRDTTYTRAYPTIPLWEHQPN